MTEWKPKPKPRLPRELLLVLAEHMGARELGVAATVSRGWASLFLPAIKKRVKALGGDPRDVEARLEATRSLTRHGQISWRAMALRSAYEAEVEAVGLRPTVRWVPVLAGAPAGQLVSTVNSYNGEVVVTVRPKEGTNDAEEEVEGEAAVPAEAAEGHPPAGLPPLDAFTVDKHLQYHRAEPLPLDMIYAKPVRGMGPLALRLEEREDGPTAQVWVTEADFARFSSIQRIQDPNQDPEARVCGLRYLCTFAVLEDTTLPVMRERYAFHLDYDWSGVIGLTAAFSGGGVVYHSQLCEVKGRYAAGGRRTRGGWERELAETNLFDYVVLDNEHIFVMPEEEGGIFIWNRGFGSYDTLVLALDGRLEPSFAANPGPTFDVTPDMLASRRPIAEWALGDGDEAVPVTPGAARVVAVERATREWFTDSAVTFYQWELDNSSVTVADRHLVWEGDTGFVVIPDYATLLEEIVSSELDEETQAALVTSRIFRFVVGPSFTGIQVIGHRVVCQMDLGALLIDLDDIQNAQVPVVQITHGFPYPAEHWRQADTNIATPTGLLEVVSLEPYLQEEYAQATKGFKGMQYAGEVPSSVGIRVLSFEPHSKFTRQAAAAEAAAEDPGAWGRVKITFVD
ncbi:uncharacterized protein LOC62_07G008856 [Vanrija pseudolonga]|uniref:F-box domain-containing protein n=1 Tax=Vanrija pseudolonga TaxID=143232 RepID=A0AAF0YIP7_9TREE|nr:hypothetical protein LOC62_07G008856 [Vanrija pseudolonga]